MKQKAQSVGPVHTGGQGKQKHILVVGDWFIDEHWVMGTHRSSSASRTGLAHYRALHQPRSTVQSFCGAGRTASLLFQVGKQEHPHYWVHGIGIWHKDDTVKLKSMFEPANLEGQTLFVLKNPEPTQPVNNVCLYNLCDILDEPERQNVCTTRIIRIYHSEGTKYAYPYYRIDWERSSPPEWVADESKLEDLVSDQGEGMPHRVDAVVVKDLGRGVISPALIRFLVNRYRRAQWFVSTKAWNPPWFGELGALDRQALHLLLIPQIAAQQAIRKELLSRWLTRGGCPTDRAIDMIEALITKVGGTHDNLRVIVLPGGFSVLAYSPRSRPDTAASQAQSARDSEDNEAPHDCYVQPEANLRSIDVDMGMASVFLPALVVGLLRSSSIELKVLLENALDATVDFVKSEANRLRDPEYWRPSSFMGESECHVRPSGQERGSVRYDLRPFKWAEQKERWRWAMNGIGVIPRHNVAVDERSEADSDTQGNLSSSASEGDRFELWRGMTDVDGYVCCIVEKQNVICNLIRAIESFRQRGKRSHVCGMLVAPPGSGKTHLVRQLAQSMNLRLLPFNISQMTSRTDILDCFDTIVTTQAQNREQVLLAFVDEINAKLDNDYVYNAFLAPIEDGVYVRGGKAFHIDPCIWIFSGTEDPSKAESTDQDRASKGSDFVSRLTLGVLDLENTGDQQARRKVEKVYQGVALLCLEFPDVRRVREKVLKAFFHMPHEVNVRDLKRFVSSFIDIQYGRVQSRNVPRIKLELKEGVNPTDHFRQFAYTDWKDRPEGSDIWIEVKEPEIRR